MKNKFYITTPIYYVNASPHIGHSYTSIAADTLARHNRQKLGAGSVRFLTGTDEHGQKIQKAADDSKLKPQEFVDRVVVQFKELWSRLNISYDDFIRTTEPRHISTVQKALEILYAKEVSGKKVVYSSEYVGWYCTPCETFWTETQIEGQLCPDCKRPVEKISEINYFFRISIYQEWLINYINKNPGFIRPESRCEEVLSFLEMNQLSDLCISRPRERLSWGIPLPFSTGHVTYVWFDALLNYISAVGSFDENGVYNSEWWNHDVEVVHLIGKDILRQHAVYWPIMLKALDIRLPDTVFAHGWWLIDDSKMSKSIGNVISPLEMVDKYGIDVYRYFLLRDVPFGLDGNFSEDAIIKRFNSDLANDLGNLVFRTLNMVEKYFSGAIPEIPLLKNSISKSIKAKVESLPQKTSKSLLAPDFDFGAAMNAVWEVISMSNKYVEEIKPWNLAKEKKTEELKEFISILIMVIRSVQKEIAPFMPHTADLIGQQLGSNTISKGMPLFPRIQAKE
ncbi:MAG: methionine--tRNA ligase [Candidatus Omnitrophota bacterium]|jgi:methionyl-tRNA synthetase|nr:MAG: methionine--tRNA ligase [Candidatus Omnitrophota bacterium]